MENEVVKITDRVGNTRIKKPIEITLSVEDGLHVGKNDELSIHAWGKTREAMFLQLSEEIDFLRMEYVEEDDENLNKGGRDLKKKLSEYIEKDQGGA